MLLLLTNSLEQDSKLKPMSKLLHLVFKARYTFVLMAFKGKIGAKMFMPLSMIFTGACGLDKGQFSLSN